VSAATWLETDFGTRPVDQPIALILHKPLVADAQFVEPPGLTQLMLTREIPDPYRY
jgi:hypothetical protein